MPIKLSDLRLNPNNPRTAKKEDFAKLVQSLKEFPKMMELRPIVVDQIPGTIFGGNQRFRALKKLGYKEIPEQWVRLASDFTPEQLQEFLLKDNISAGVWNFDALASGWDTKQLSSWGLILPGTKKGRQEVQDDDFTAPANPETVKTTIVPGDLFEIGPHRLLCGDATDPAALQLISGELRPDLVHTDPPYGVEFIQKNITGGDKAFGKTGGKPVQAGRYEPIIGDDTTDTAERFYTAARSLGIDNYIIWGGNYFTAFLPPSKGWIVWDKKGRAWDDNYSDFEMAWTSFDRQAKIFTHLWMGMLQEGKREKRVHPMQKPAKLVGDCITYYHPGARVILDGFGGSGSTMVAAHQLAKVCLMIEIAPYNCQIILDRMHRLDPGLPVTKNGKPYRRPSGSARSASK